jgi:hypothetical protein
LLSKRFFAPGTKVAPLLEHPVTWLADYSVAGEACFRIGRVGDEVIAEWVGAATLIARRDGTGARLTFEPTADLRTVEKIRRGSAWLLLRQLEGKIALHGSAVRYGNRALVFLGRSGDGKSTIAAAMCRRGAELLADDAVGVDVTANGWVVQPHELDHWLDGAARRALGEGTAADEPRKAPVRSTSLASEPTMLAAFVALEFADVEPKLIRLHGIEAVAPLVPQVARLVIDEPERQKRELDLLFSLVDALPVHRLVRPRDLDRLEDVVDLVLEQVGCTA